MRSATLEEKLIYTRPLTPRPTWLGRIEAGNHARSVLFTQAGRERTLTQFVPSSLPDPDDEIVEWVGLEAWVEKADDSDEELVPEPMPDDPDHEPRDEISDGDPAAWLSDEDEAWEIASFVVEYDCEEEDHDLDYEAWVNDPDEDGELSLPRRSPAEKGEHGYVDKHANRRHRKSWARYPHRHHFHGVTEADIARLREVSMAFRDDERYSIPLDRAA